MRPCRQLAAGRQKGPSGSPQREQGPADTGILASGLQTERFLLSSAPCAQQAPSGGSSSLSEQWPCGFSREPVWSRGRPQRPCAPA